MLMNLAQMRKDKIVNKMFDNLKLLKDRLQYYDLELLNITCDKISGLPLEYCVIERLYTEGNIRAIKEYPFLKTIYTDEDLLKAKQNPKIIHFCGKCPKIWKRKTKDIPQYYLEYIKRSPFYDKNLFFPSVKGISFKFLLFLLSKFSFSRNVRHKYRRQLGESRY